MRNAFAAELTELATKDNRIVLLSGDIGNRLFDNYKAQHNERFFNCGVAEANMTGMAAGMALCGLKPITYTIAPFVTTRCLEQIRDDICYHNVPVTVVSVGGGLSYAGLGPTHHSCEDIAFLRVLPGMSVICPGDAVEVRLALRAAMNHDGPVYIRLGKKNEPVIHESEPNFQIGKSITIREGQDVCLLNTGNLLPITLEAADKLEEQGISVRVESFHTVKPLDTELLEQVFSDYKIVATVEEHSILAGLGGSVAEWLADHYTLKARLLRFGTADTFFHESGSQAYAREYFGLTPDKICHQVAGALGAV